MQQSTSRPSVLLDDQGIEWARFQIDQRELVSLRDIPVSVQHAFLATEDRSFYQHAGISWYGIIRSFIKNIILGRFAQGASTITQQLVRILFFDTKKTLMRKLKEQLLAVVVEQHFSKDAILESYLNHIYFGCGIYGVAAAAQRFWNKSIQDITIDEAAVLAGIVKSPGNYCPLINLEGARQRRNVVLNCMMSSGYITPADAHTFAQRELNLCPSSQASCKAPHLFDMIRADLEKKFGRHLLYTGGLIIQTTLNQELQSRAVELVHNHIAHLKQSTHPDIDGALVTIDNASGAVKALVGGYDYKTSPFNRAKASRQVGSLFKPLIYTIAYEHGLYPTDICIDEPTTFMSGTTAWQPRNVTNRFEGPMTRARALTNSNNIIAVKTFLEVGAEPVIIAAHACGFRQLHSYPSLALGCIDATVCELTAYFSLFTNQGKINDNFYIQWIKDASGKRIWQHQNTTTQITSATAACIIRSILAAAMERWHRIFPELPHLPCESIGKTGTTNDIRNCWFAGSTPTYTTVIYLGRDNHEPLGAAYAVRTALPLWLNYNALIPQPQTCFHVPHGFHEHTMHGITGLPENRHSPEAITLLQEISSSS